MLQTHEKAGNLLWHSLALDESTDLSSTSQLLVLILGINEDIQITEELAFVCSMHESTTGKVIFMEVKKMCRTITFNGISIDVLRLTEEKTWLE